MMLQSWTPQMHVLLLVVDMAPATWDSSVGVTLGLPGTTACSHCHVQRTAVDMVNVQHQEAVSATMVSQALIATPRSHVLDHL